MSEKHNPAFYESTYVPSQRSEFNSSADLLGNPHAIYNYLLSQVYKQDDYAKDAAMFLFNHARGIPQRLFVCGPSGSGKTYMFECIKRIWPHLTFVNAATITGQGWKGDNKITDLLYLCHAHLTYGVSCDEIFDKISSRFIEIRDELGLSFRIEDEYPAEAAADAEAILRAYLDSYDHSDDNGTWFDKIRQIAVDLGYAAKPKDFKKNPDDYKGHVGHVSTVIRIALMGRAQSPDVWSIQQIMGEDKVRERIGAGIG